MNDLNRRDVLKLAGTAVALPFAGQSAAGVELATAQPLLSAVAALAPGVTRTFVAPQLWANRLEDWRLNQGRIECMVSGRARTIAALTRALKPGGTSARLTVRTGTLTTGDRFSGFLLGAGAGHLDYRAAAIVQGASGEGGGFFCTYEATGRVGFREHTNENDQFAFAPLVTARAAGAPLSRSTQEDVQLTLDITPTPAKPGYFTVTLAASDTATGSLLSRGSRLLVPDRQLVGGIALVSSSGSGARHWFRDFSSSAGGKISARSVEAGPILGTQYSLNGTTLKLTAQLLPIGGAEPQTVDLDVRPSGTEAWTTRATATLGAGHVAAFRITDWNSSVSWEYRAVWARDTGQEHAYGGLIRREPAGSSTLSIAMINCTIHSYRPLDSASSRSSGLPGETPQGLYTRRNLYFPYEQVAANVARQHPDLIVALGDQFYEWTPTERERAVDSRLDVLYRYYLWLWSFRELTRSTPTITLIDDHDVYQPNLWGWGGIPAPEGNYNFGGYTQPVDWISLVQSIQCGHNPDPYDPRPAEQGMPVYFGQFSYGGVSFAFLEDRKFKDTTANGLDINGAPLPKPRQLLGTRQEAFLGDWVDRSPGEPKVCLTQTLWGCLQTTARGAPLKDNDSNGSPADSRREALQLVKRAKAILLSGDQHLGSLTRQGIDSFADGVMQFVTPAAGSAFQRWFTPAAPLPNAGASPESGDFVDAFGNKMRVFAVANPKITFTTYLRYASAPAKQRIGDPNLKREGYGLVRVDKQNARYIFECWPGNVDPTTSGTQQYPGWPYVLPFSDV